MKGSSVHAIQEILAFHLVTLLIVGRGQKVWESETMPDDWSEAVIIRYFKQGYKRQCSNYGSISLVDIADNVYVAL